MLSLDPVCVGGTRDIKVRPQKQLIFVSEIISHPIIGVMLKNIKKTCD